MVKPRHWFLEEQNDGLRDQLDCDSQPFHSAI